MQDAQLHFRALGAADARDHVLQAQLLCGLAVDGQDDVPGLEPGTVGGRILDGRHHGHLAVLHRDLDADAGELAGGGLLHLLVLFGRHEGGVRIKALQHALERTVQQFALVHVLHIIAVHQIQHLAETAQGLKVLLDLVFVGPGGSGGSQRAAEGQHAKENGQTEQSSHGLPPEKIIRTQAAPAGTGGAAHSLPGRLRNGHSYLFQVKKQ